MHGRTLRLALAVVGTVVSVGAEVLAVLADAEVGQQVLENAGEPARVALLHLVIGLTYLYGGLAIWAHAPANKTGMKMTAVGLTWWFQAIAKTGIPVWADLGNMLYDIPTVFIFALVLAYPSGQLRTGADRVAIAIVLIGSTALNMVQFVPTPVVVNEGINGLFVGVALATLTIVMILRRWVTAPSRSRRELLPVLVAGTVLIVSLAINLGRRIFDVSDTLGDVLVAVNDLAPAAIPIALLIGFFRQSEDRMRALIDAIPDRIIRIVDGHGTNVRGEGAAPGASPTDIVVARQFDAMTGGVGEVAASAARRAIDEGRLQSFDFTIETAIGQREFEARVVASGPDEATAIIRDFTDQRAIDSELRRSRARIVEVADAERRRLERDLHDGAQQRLVALSLSLRLLRARLGQPDGSNDEAIAAADEAATELKLALAELRELARGIHPAILTEAGLAAAISALAERSVVPAVVTALPDRRLPANVEATAYFVVSESLTNAAKHANASRIGIGAACADSVLTVEVTDDGVGGADRAKGSGLEGLNDRVAAIGGRMTVDSPRGQGTRIVAEIPLA